MIDEDRVPFLDRKLIERRDMLNARIVDEHVEPAMLGERGRDHLGDRVRLRHVGRRIAHLDAEIRRDQVPGPGDLRGKTETVQHDGRAGFGERAGDAEPDAAGGAGNQRDLAGERPRSRRRTLRFQLNVHGRPFYGREAMTSAAELFADGICTTGSIYGNASWLPKP